VVLLSGSSNLKADELDDDPTLRTLRTIVLDPGHGGSNDGAFGVAGIFERFLTLETAFELRRELGRQLPDLNVILTREGDFDIGLSERTHVANLHDADLFISIHYNAAENLHAQGIEVFFLSTDRAADLETPGLAVAGPSGAVVASILRDLGESRDHRLSADLARDLLNGLIETSGAVNRGVRQASFRVLRGAHMPAVVVELGFLTNDDEGIRALDPEYRHLLVQGLVDGIREYAARP
jgi:N-acetylmuramoyl-L-alanine amidase